jgi:ABC-type branched-subunit amino acid transport system permease subunit
MVALAGAAVLLVVADILAFHDVFEPHTVRDWMMLVGSILVVAALIDRSGLLRTAGRRS